jgi:hypothetical protein
MQKEKDKGKKKRDLLPKTFNSISETAKFLDGHDSTDLRRNALQRDT